MGAVLAASSASAAQQVENAQAPAAGQSAAAPAPVANPLKIDAYSRHLQWLRTADDVADAVIEMGYQGLDITVMPYPGHVDPANVAKELPPFVNTIHKHGIIVRNIRCPIMDADSANAEEILATASSLGITHYWGLGLRYASDKPIFAQLDEFKPRVEKIAALNAKYKITGMYHTYSGDTIVGAAVWDLLYLLKNVDPSQIGLHYDVGHMTNAGGNGTWALNLRAAAQYIAGVSVKDSVYERVLDMSDGGAYTGQPLGGFGGPGRGPGAAGAQGAPGGAGGFGAAGGRGPAEAGAPGAGVPPASAGTPPPAAAPSAEVTGPSRGSQAEAGNPGRGAAAAGSESGRGGRGGPGGAAAGGRGFAGRGGPAVPSRGGGGQTNPWRVRQVPLGEGMDDLPKLASVLREINFSGPVEIEAEYPNGGAGNAADKITLPREQVLGAMKRDRLVLMAAFQTAGLV